jgi:hypothetical protein
MEFMDAIKAIDERKKVSCICGDEPVIYQVINEELTVNGKIYDFRNFCFSPSQILFGTWKIEAE